MSLFLPSAILFLLLITVTVTVAVQNATISTQCQLNFDLLRRIKPDHTNNFDDQKCLKAAAIFQLLQSEYLRRTGNFHPPLPSCWEAFKDKLTFHRTIPGFNCNANDTMWFAQRCQRNFTSRADYESWLLPGAISRVTNNCNRTLDYGRWCLLCRDVQLLLLFGLHGHKDGFDLDLDWSCLSLPEIYTAAFRNPFGPMDPQTALCLFGIELVADSHLKKTLVILAAVCGSLAVVAILVSSAFVLWYRGY